MGARGVSVPATPVAKLKTLFQQLAVGFALFPPTAVDGRRLWLTLLWIAVVLTVVSGAHYLLRARRVATQQVPRIPQSTVIVGRGVAVVMSCEVVAVGTELLLGQIVDTNSAWIGEQLAASGIASHHQVKVGDNLARIVDALRLALGRADAVIVCGGLGPTHDDITREAMAEVMGVSLLADEAVAARIREMFAARNRAMPDNNLRQALRPGRRRRSSPRRGAPRPGSSAPSATASPTSCRACPTRWRRWWGEPSCPTCGGARAIRRSSSAGCCGRGARARAGSTSACAPSSTGWRRRRVASRSPSWPAAGRGSRSA